MDDKNWIGQYYNFGFTIGGGQFFQNYFMQIGGGRVLRPTANHAC